MGRVRSALATAAAALMAAAAMPAAAAPLQALSAHDLSLYAAAFDAAERGDAAAADAAVAQVSDACLTGKVRYVEMTHDRSRGPTYEQLSNWLKTFGDMPGASLVYEMALKLKPADALPPAPVATLAGASDGSFHMAPAAQSKPAREAYFNGDVPRALQIARSSGDAWIAGLAAYRLGQYGDAMISFERLAANPSEDDPTRAAGGVWAAKAAVAAGHGDRAEALLRIAAAAHPGGFYGMIAKRRLELTDDPVRRTEGVIGLHEVIAHHTVRAAEAIVLDAPVTGRRGPIPAVEAIRLRPAPQPETAVRGSLPCGRYLTAQALPRWPFRQGVRTARSTRMDRR